MNFVVLFNVLTSHIDKPLPDGLKLFILFNATLSFLLFFSSSSSKACIDENLDMVKFLVENGADVNQQDNEGWTPLHAVASCGYLNIAE